MEDGNQVHSLSFDFSADRRNTEAREVSIQEFDRADFAIIEIGLAHLEAELCFTVGKENEFKMVSELRKKFEAAKQSRVFLAYLAKGQKL